MPELPEVEVVRAGLAATATGRRVVRVVSRVPALRWPIPPQALEQPVGRVLLGVERRSKYLLLSFEPGCLIVHLGMSGTLSWRSVDAPLRAHDHLDLVFEQGLLRLNDPRRFGAVLWHPAAAGAPQTHPLMARLGVEPFSPEFTAERMFGHTRGRTLSIKSLLLSGSVVVGVGNIYASESLFRAGIRPTTAAGRIGLARYQRLATAIRETLTEAIAAGGSTLRDFVSSEGASGYFQQTCFVYDRAGQPCRVCGQGVRSLRQQQRATFWCSTCQT